MRGSTLPSPPAIGMVGIGLRQPHFQFFAEQEIEPSLKPDFLEIHTENYFFKDALPRAILRGISEKYPISAHSIGLSLGSVGGLDIAHLQQTKEFVEEFRPIFVSDHLSWSISWAGSADGINIASKIAVPDLLPVPYTKEAMQVFCRNIEQAQEKLGQEFMIENPSSYIMFKENEYQEAEFIQEIANKTGCKILLDVNNIVVSANNHNFNAEEYLAYINPKSIGEIHIAGFSSRNIAGKKYFIDDHGSSPREETWDLFNKAIAYFGNKTPVLIEWDNDLPQDANILLNLVKKVRQIYTNCNL